jgi:Flp pilus assembly protein CpaB
MNRKRLVMIALLLVAVVLVFIFLLVQVRHQQHARAGRVLFASKRLGRGSFLNRKDTVWQAVAVDQIAKGALTQASTSEASLQQAILTRTVLAHQMIKKTDLAVLDRHFSYRQVLKKGHVASTVYTSIPAHTLIKRGDRVNVMAVYPAQASQGRGAGHSQALVSQALVLAVAGEQSQAKNSRLAPTAKGKQWVILETSAQENARLQGVKHVNLAIVLSAHTDGQAKPLYVAKTTAHKPANKALAEQGRDHVILIKGSKKEVVYFK